ncbi:FAD-binding PCMH-type domain-containing protein [Fusarium sp. LHS14.1]|nr:FAD-binding PCMH-type domain-containing protein [Fusarium sp. LHS14.1]
MSAPVETPEPIPTLQDSIQQLGQLVKDLESELDEKELPGLDKLIVTKEAFARRILQVFRDSTHNEVYDDVKSNLPGQRGTVLDKFVDGAISAKDAGALLAELEGTPAGATPASGLHVQNLVLTSAKKATTPDRKFIKGKVENQVFENWGRTVKNTPAVTYYPENTAEIQTIVRDAVKNGSGVRVSGFRHSWAPVFGRNGKVGQKNNGDVLISTLTEHNAGVLPNFTSLPSSLFQPKETELNHIKIVDAAYVSGQALSGGKKYVRVGTSTTNEQVRRWCINEGNVTLPMNIIEVEITFGGSNATICHGAGIKHPTLSDLVRCIEYVDVHGELRTVDMADAKLLKAASGCFGLLGVVTHITFECDPMSTAVMIPMKLDAIDAIPPPPKDSDIPEPLRQPRTEQEKQTAFWFPYSSQVWVNTWKTDNNTKDVVNYPSTAKTFIQILGTAIMNTGQNILQEIDALQARPHMQTTFLSWLAMKNLDERKEGEKPIRTLLPNALHFQRGVQNIRVRDLEVEIPLHSKKGTTDQRDYTNVRHAWWDAIKICYANVDTCPMRMPLEMRIMGSSEVTMAPQRGHKLGTCVIEILTLRAVADIWEPYAQQVLDKWSTYKDNDGQQIVLSRTGQRSGTIYKNGIVEFKGLMAEIGKKHGWTLADLKKTFSNEVLDYLYLDYVAVSQTKKKPQVQVQEVPVAATTKV